MPHKEPSHVGRERARERRPKEKQRKAKKKNPTGKTEKKIIIKGKKKK